MDMTAIMNHPRYQRHIQKMASWRPEQRAIFNSALIDEHYGTEFSRRLAASVQDRVQREGQRMRLDRAKTASDRDFELRREAMDYSRTQAKRARPLEYANVAANVGRGILDAKEAAKDAGMKRKMLAILGG